MLYEGVIRKIKRLNVLKLSQQSGIPTKVLIGNCEYFTHYFYENKNFCLGKSLLFLLDLKLADIVPVYKKKFKSTENRPVSILSNMSKVYERCIYDQIHSCLGKILSSKQCGFCKGYNAQHCLIALIE